MLLKVRNVLFWVHLSLGITTALVALILCVTGAILAVELPVTRWADQRHVVAPAQAPDLPAVEPLAKAVQLKESKPPASFTISRDPRDPAVVSFGRRDQVYYDPWRGESLGKDPSGLHEVFRGVMVFHRWFALSGAGRDVGRMVVGVSTLGFVIITLTGVFLWLPRRWRWPQLRAVIWFKRGLKGKARDFNWHHVLGIWFVVPLLFFAVTGAGIGFKWLNAGLVRAAGGEVSASRGKGGPPRGRGDDARGDDARGDITLTTRMVGADAAMALAAKTHPDWQRMSVDTPASASAPIKITVDAGNGRQVQHQTVLTIARPAPRIIRTSGWGEATRDRQVRTVIRFGHTGELFGALGLLLAVLACVAGAVLSVTGGLLSWRRYTAWQKRRARAAARAEDETT